MKISDYVESQIKGLWGTDFDENGIPVIKTNNLTYEGHIDYSDICKRNITREHAKECYLKPGDLLIEKSGGTKTHSVGYVSYFEGDENKFVCNNFILALRLKNTINSKFLFYQIQFKYESNQFSDCFNKTTGIQNLKVKDYLAKEIKIYSPEEQEKIVKELDTVRSTINKNKQILEKYDTLIKSRFIEMFGDNSTENGKWNIEKIEDICTVTSSKRIYAEEQSTTGVPFLRISDLVSRINGNPINDLFIPNSKFKEFQTKGLVPSVNDILITSRGTLGLCYIIKPEDEFYFQDGMITWLAFKNHNKVLSVFIDWLFKSILKTKIDNETNGATVKYVSISDLKKLQIPVPPLSLQNDFASFVHQIDKSKFALQKSLEKTETLYKSLMQRYFA